MSIADSTRHEGKFRVTRYSDGTVSLASRCNEMYLSSADFGAIQGRREGCVWSVVCVPGDNQNGMSCVSIFVLVLSSYKSFFKATVLRMRTGG